MLRKKLLALVFAGSIFGTFSANAQVYEKGNIIVDAYIGGPNFFSAVVKSAYDASGYDEVKVSSIGPIGARGEYVLSERIGIGLNVNYANTKVSFKIDDVDSNGDVKSYDYEASIPRLRVMPTFNIHMGNSDRLDPYFSFGAGYSSFKFKEKTDAPNYQIGSVNVNSGMPLAFRAEFGLRYFFTDNIGLHGQVGIGGGPLVAGGLSLKF